MVNSWTTHDLSYYLTHHIRQFLFNVRGFKYLFIPWIFLHVISDLMFHLSSFSVFILSTTFSRYRQTTSLCNDYRSLVSSGVPFINRKLTRNFKYLYTLPLLLNLCLSSFLGLPDRFFSLYPFSKFSNNVPTISTFSGFIKNWLTEIDRCVWKNKKMIENI